MSGSLVVRRLLSAVLLSTAVGALACILYLLTVVNFEHLGIDGKIRAASGFAALQVLFRSLGNPDFLRQMLPLYALVSAVFFLGYTRFGRALFR